MRRILKSGLPGGMAGGEEVAVVFKTHLDIGFTDLAENVVRCYMERYIPDALELAAKTRHEAHRFVWTTGAWLACRFLEDAPARLRRKLEEAVRQGDFHWHAMPFTTHSELLDGGLFRRGLAYSQKLDAHFGRKTTAAKMTDVPGHTRGIVPLLADAGVRLLHIGVNPASTAPDVPPVFRWKCEGKEVVVVYEKVYGATTRLSEKRILSVHLTGDNLGPQSPEEIAGVYIDLSKRFPGARLKPSGLNEVADWLWKQREALPLVEEEIGDTWIHGAGADPAKVARFRELSRLRNHWITQGRLAEGGKADRDLSENLLLVAEHTWGMDIKTHLRDWRIYSPKALRQAREKANFKKVENSWKEQRAYLDRAVSRLPLALRKEAEGSLRQLLPARAGKQGWLSVHGQEPLCVGPWKIRLDSGRGFLRGISREGEFRELVDARHGVAALQYQTFSREDYDRFYREYNTWDVEWARQDFTKEGLPPSAASETFSPRLRGVFRTRSGDRLLLVSDFPSKARTKGAPAVIKTEVTEADGGLDVCLQWFEKTATRQPEALWLGFSPKLKRSTWRFRKMGVWLDPEDVVRDGNRHLHAVNGGLEADGEFTLNSLDAILVAPGVPQLLRHHNRPASCQAGISFNLYNNVWGTNFPMWSSDDARFRFELRWPQKIT